MPSTRVERVTFPLQVERATTTPTRHYDSSWLNAGLITGFGDRGRSDIRIDFKRAGLKMERADKRLHVIFHVEDAWWTVLVFMQPMG